MNNKKGMTLIEVIMAVFLLGLISVVFLPSTWSSYNMMSNAKEITADTFDAQQEIEIEMEEARDAIHDYHLDNSKPNPLTESITAFGKTVKGALVEKSITDKDNTKNRGTLSVFIGDEPVIDENLPSVDNVKLVALSSDENKRLVYWNEKNIALNGSYTKLNLSNYYTSLIRWYASGDGFDAYIPSADITESYWIGRYPNWTYDFKLLKETMSFATTDSLSINFKDYINEYIVFSVIPIAKTGKYCEEGTSRIYVMGPPVMDGITFHFDPYTLRKTTGDFFVDGDRITSSNKWKDYSISYDFNPFYTTTDTMKIDYVDDGKAVVFDGAEARLTYGTRNTNFDPTNNTNSFTVFMVYRNTGTATSQGIIKRNSGSNNGWEIGLNQDTVEFKVNQSGNPVSIFQGDYTKAAEKYIITAVMSSPNMQLILDTNGYSEIILGNSAYRKVNESNATFILGDTTSKENMYEIIIYNRSLSTSEIMEVREYLAKKHRIQLEE